MREARTAFGMSGRGGFRAFATTVALMAGIPACGSITVVGPPTPPDHFQQVTCLVTRTECTGWEQTTTDKLDNLDVHCPTGNFATMGPFNATICYKTAGGGTFEQQKADAQKACDSYCASGFGGLYPLGSVANKGGPVTCQATELSDTIADEIPGQCTKTTTQSPGATTFALCNLFGRACNGQQTAPDGTQFCTLMPPVISGQSTSSCFDSSITTAESVCQNSFEFPDMPPGAVNKSVQFAYWNVANVELNDSESACQAEADNLGTSAYGVGAGPIGSFSMQGTTTALTSKGGFATLKTSCDSTGEFCVTKLKSLKVQLADVTVAGLTLHNPEANLVTSASTNFGTTSLPVNAVKLSIEGDITGMGRARTVWSNPQPMTLSTSGTNASLSGAFSATVNTSLIGTASLTGNISITASTTSPNAGCANQSTLQQLLGFETTADWSSPQVPLSLTTSRKTQGCFGMQVGGGNYRTLNSVPFATPLPGTTGTLGLDVFNPPNPPNPFWLGAVQMYLSCPSANFNNQYIGQVELTGKPLNAFSTLNFPIPAPILSVLQGSHPDCFFSIAVNANATPTPPVLDNLRFK